jgi:hypothetical protein
MAFIYTLDGNYIALSDVVRATPQKDGFRLLLASSGDSVTISDHAWGEAMRGDIKGVLPAPEGYFVVERLTDEDDTETTHREPVLGWALNTSGTVIAVTATGLAIEAQDVLVPDGRVVHGDGWFDKLAEWEAKSRA